MVFFIALAIVVLTMIITASVSKHPAPDAALAGGVSGLLLTLILCIIGATNFNPISGSYETVVDGQRYYCEREAYVKDGGWFFPGYEQKMYVDDDARATCWRIGVTN